MCLILGPLLGFTDTVAIKAIVELEGFNKGTGISLPSSHIRFINAVIC
jgi:hypothetical protein